MNTQIKAEDLRIGNYLDRNGLMQVTAIHKTKINVYDHYNKIGNPNFFPAESFKGLPITEELLLKAGFKSIGDLHPTYQLNPYIIELSLMRDKYVMRQIINKEESVRLADLKYFHQLQNIFYWLSGGKELTL